MSASRSATAEPNLSPERYVRLQVSCNTHRMLREIAARNDKSLAFMARLLVTREIERTGRLLGISDPSQGDPQ